MSDVLENSAQAAGMWYTKMMGAAAASANWQAFSPTVCGVSSPYDSVLYLGKKAVIFTGPAFAGVDSNGVGYFYFGVGVDCRLISKGYFSGYNPQVAGICQKVIAFGTDTLVTMTVYNGVAPTPPIGGTCGFPPSGYPCCAAINTYSASGINHWYAVNTGTAIGGNTLADCISACSVYDLDLSALCDNTAMAITM